MLGNFSCSFYVINCEKVSANLSDFYLMLSLVWSQLATYVQCLLFFFGVPFIVAFCCFKSCSAASDAETKLF